MSLIKTVTPKRGRIAQPLVKLVSSLRHHQTSWRFLAGRLWSGALMASVSGTHWHKKFLHLFSSTQAPCSFYSSAFWAHCSGSGLGWERFITTLLLFGWLGPACIVLWQVLTGVCPSVMLVCWCLDHILLPLLHPHFSKWWKWSKISFLIGFNQHE